MADTLLEILDALLTTTPGERALREARALGDSQEAQDERIARLEAQVASLQRTVATLTDVLVRTDVVGAGDRSTILRAARRQRESFTSEVDDVPAEPTPAMVGSPYRGVSRAVTPRPSCAACGKELHRDDPDLSLASRGRVCTMCFTRGG